ncbi:squamosa promoter-binding-like protein 7 [Phtheirospermum japonicum]|uniref:Squamosa promoter-binding-like protein 7 n=1 Tax=Phtheirospermum japonicum TaxID=374723 RepID=A0A830BAR7_9LAMI|nr:squamosa promoter-binding-like protein 7 [Phtheirospermum japonicum]
MQQNSSSPIPTPAYLPRDPLMASVDPTSFEWSDLLDFNLDETLYAPFPDIGSGSGPDQSQSPSESSGQVRKRDPRLVCSNFLAGRIPCACPELDELLEEAESGLPGKKRARMSRASGASPMRCQVPGCEVDISELKGYHKRHRVCLRCANASSVVLDGESKRYCQQCGKFHLLPDFDEGKRSCRRKLERHNNRRRRKPDDSKGGVEKEAQQVISADDVSVDDAGKDGICLSSQIEERALRLEPDGHVSTLCSALDFQNLGGDSVASIVAPGEVHTHGQKQNPIHNKRSPSYGDNKNTFSSTCPAGRISFKLYDWNPAEFPRRLRHQIFEWLASMPVELEGYIRPGCTILTAFIAMPKPMWLKLLEEPGLCIKDLFAPPGNLLSGRGTMLVYLNDIIFRVTKDGNSVVKFRVKDRSPKLHYIHPNCFEAGQPMEFVACGSDLLQPKFRFLVSFAGRYLAYNICVSSLCCTKGDSNSFDHQLVKISVPQTDASLTGPAFIEVENQSGLSNFIPILVGDKETCAEMEILQQKLEMTSRPVCQVFAIRQSRYSEFLLDVAWSLKKPGPDQPLTSSHVQRFNHLSNFLIEKKSSVILDRVVCSMKSAIDNNLVAAGISEADMNALRKNMGIAESMLDRRLQGKDFTVTCENVYSKKDKRFVVPASDTNMAGPGALSSSHEDAGSTDPLINREVVMNVINLHNAKPSKSCSPLIPRTFSTSRPVIMAIAVIGVCLGVCAVMLHPQGVGQIAITIRRCLFES